MVKLWKVFCFGKVIELNSMCATVETAGPAWHGSGTTFVTGPIGSRFLLRNSKSVPGTFGIIFLVIRWTALYRLISEILFCVHVFSARRTQRRLTLVLIDQSYPLLSHIRSRRWYFRRDSIKDIRF